MPIFTYICTKCKTEKDRLVTSSTANSQQCGCEDDAPMVRDDRVYASGISLKGNWFKNNGQY